MEAAAEGACQQGCFSPQEADILPKGVSSPGTPLLKEYQSQVLGTTPLQFSSSQGVFPKLLAT